MYVSHDVWMIIGDLVQHFVLNLGQVFVKPFVLFVKPVAARAVNTKTAANIYYGLFFRKNFFQFFFAKRIPSIHILLSMAVCHDFLYSANVSSWLGNFFTASAALLPNLSLNSASAINLIIAFSNSFWSSTGMTIPLSLFLITSPAKPTSVIIIGKPCVAASTTVNPQPSLLEVSKNTSACR